MSDNRPLTGDNPKPWFKKKRIIIPLAFLVLGVFGSLTGKSGTSSTGGGGTEHSFQPKGVSNLIGWFMGNKRQESLAR